MSIAFTLAANSIDDASSTTLGTLLYRPAAAVPVMGRLERLGFTAVTIDDAGGCLNNLALASHALSANGVIRVFATHWAGVMEPGIAAAESAALAIKFNGRFGLRICPGMLGDSADVERRTDHARAWRATGEYLDSLKRACASHPALERARSDIPIRMGGRSGSALQVAGKHADIFEIDPGSLYKVSVLVDRMRAAAYHHGRADRIRFALPIRISLKQRVPRWERVVEELLDQAAGYIELGVSEFTVFGLEGFPRLFAGCTDEMVGRMSNVHYLDLEHYRPRRARQAFGHD